LVVETKPLEKTEKPHTSRCVGEEAEEVPNSRPAPASVGARGSKYTGFEFISITCTLFWWERSQPSFRENFSVPRLNGQKRYNHVSFSGNTAAGWKKKISYKTCGNTATK